MDTYLPQEVSEETLEWLLENEGKFKGDGLEKLIKQNNFTIQSSLDQKD